MTTDPDHVKVSIASMMSTHTTCILILLWYGHMRVQAHVTLMLRKVIIVSEHYIANVCDIVLPSVNV